METLFIRMLNLSINASIMIAAILFFRLVFRKAPKWINCLIWSLVGIRLLFPFSIESSFSLIPKQDPIPSSIVIWTPVSSVAQPDVTTSLETSVNASRSSTGSILQILSYVWIVGLILMLVYAVFSYLSLRNKVKTATLYSVGVKQSENVTSPFVLGIVKPTIFIPYSLDGPDLKYVLSHERAHIRRRDYLWKPIGFLILSVYWFNPVIWLAYISLCRDIELACDERVINRLNSDARKEYSRALLNCSVKHKLIIACPVAFGETDVKGRVKKVMNYKKPAFWIIILAVLCCIAVGVCFMTYPKTRSIADNEKDNVAKETNGTESAQTITTDISDSGKDSLRKMNIDDINQLKTKTEFSWDDFSLYESEDIGSGLFVFKYELDEGGYVLVSGPSLDQKPQTIMYYRPDGKVDYILSNPNLSEKDGWSKYEIAPACPSRVTFSFCLPDTWECGMCIQSEDDPTSCFSVSIHPKTEDESNGAIIIAYMDGFGVLGTPVIEDTMFNGHKAKMYTCEGASYWNYIELNEPYLGCVIQNTASESWYEMYESELKEILSTVEYTIVETD